MATGKITKRSVEAISLPPRGKRAHLWDDTLKGFGVMVTDRGVRSYLIQYRIGGRGAPTRRVTIGKHGSPWTAERARVRAAELLEQVRRKVDPFAAERERLAAERAALAAAEAESQAATKLAFSVFADRFVEKYAKVKQPKTWRDTESVIRRDLKPYFLNKPLPTILPADVTALLDVVQDRGDGAAIKAYKALRSVFGWAVEKHVIPASPMQNMKPPAAVEVRDRCLSEDELRLVWRASGGLGWPFGPIVRLLILTGQRLREVSEVRWSELDLDAALWTLPGTRTKNGETTLVPLSEPVLTILRELPRIKSSSGLAFTTTGETPVSGFSKIKARLDASMLDLQVREKEADRGGSSAAIEPWRFHDLRRTFASGCQRLGVKLEVTESLLNHVSGTRSGIIGVYQTYKYEAEKRDAMAAWGRHIASVVSNTRAKSNVIPLVRA